MQDSERRPSVYNCNCWNPPAKDPKDDGKWFCPRHGWVNEQIREMMKNDNRYSTDQMQ